MSDPQTLLRSVAQCLGLPYVPGGKGTPDDVARILAGTWLPVSCLQPMLVKKIEIYLSETEIGEAFSLRLCDDPVGVLLGANAIQNWQSFTQGDRILQREIYNPYFASYLPKGLELVIETCEVNDVYNQLPLRDDTLIKRLWQQILPSQILIGKHGSKAGVLDNLSFSEIRKFVIYKYDFFIPSIKKRVHNNWHSATINRKGGGPLILKRKYEILGIEDPTIVIDRAGRWASGLSRGAEGSMQGDAALGSSNLALIQHSGGMGAGHFLEILSEAKSLNSLGGAAIMLMVSGFVDPSRMHVVDLSRAGDYYILSSNLPKRAEYAGYNSKLCLQHDAQFQRAVPCAIIDQFLHFADGCSAEFIQQEIERFLKSVAPYLSKNMLISFLMHNAPLGFELDRTFMAFGFTETFLAGGWIAYARHNPENAVIRSSRYFETIGIDVTSLVEISKMLGTCGSGGVISATAAEQLFGQLHARLEETYLITGVRRDDLRSMARWNGTVGIFCLLMQCLCFLRPYKFKLPSIFMKSELIYEKIGNRKIIFGPIIRSIIIKIDKKFKHFCNQIEREFDIYFDPVESCCAFLNFSTTDLNVTLGFESSAHRIIRSLCEDSTLAEFRDIYPGFTRHSSDYALRMGGFSESIIDILSDHSLDRSKSPIEKSKLEGYADVRLHGKAELATANYLGLTKL